MRSPVLAALAVLALLASGCSEREEKPRSAPLRAPDLSSVPSRGADDSSALRLRRWGDTASFLVLEYGDRVRALEVSPSASGDRVAELRIAGCEQLLDAAAEAGERFVLCAAGDALLFRRSDVGGASWSSETILDALPDDPDELFYGLALDADRRAILGTHTLLLRTQRTGGWQKLSLAAIDPSLRRSAGSIALTRDSVWIGYGRGDQVGGLFRIPIDETGGVGAVEKLLDLGVIDIRVADPSGGVWVAGGSARLTHRSAFLVRIQGSSIASIVAQDDSDSPRMRRALSVPSHQLPPDSSFAAFSLSTRGRPLVLDPERGIYEFAEDAFGMGSLRFAAEGMKTQLVGNPDAEQLRSYRDFLMLPDGAFALTTSDGQIVLLPNDAPARVVPLP